MASTYPAALDALSTAHLDGVLEIIHASTINDLADAVNKIEAELGTLPKGAFADVKTAIAAALLKSTVTTAGDLLVATGNAALTRLGIGAAGQVLAVVGGVLTWVYPPGFAMGYTQIVSPVTIASTTEATGTTILSPGALTFDGSPWIVEFFGLCGGTATAAGAFLEVNLFEGATQITRLAEVQNPAASAIAVPTRTAYQFTPTAGAHTYTVTAFKGANWTTALVNCGAAGTGGYPPAFVRFTKV